MKGIVLTLFGIMFIGFFTGCSIMGNANVISQERKVEGFNSIMLDGVGNVNVHSNENYKVIVITDSNLQDLVLTTVNGNNLRISQRSGSLNPTELTIDVYMPELRNISLSGAGNFQINNGTASELNYSLSGA